MCWVCDGVLGLLDTAYLLLIWCVTALLMGLEDKVRRTHTLDWGSDLEKLSSGTLFIFCNATEIAVDFVGICL